MVTLLVAGATAKRLPIWTPVLFLAGFVAVSVNLDLLPFGSLLVLGALTPLVRRPPAPVRSAAS
jgi:hypothetical protein